MQTMEVNHVVLSKISEAKYLLLSLCSNFLDKEVTGDTSGVGKTFSGDRGRPQYNITKEQLEYFIEFGFSARQIATLLDVSEATTGGDIVFISCRLNATPILAMSNWTKR